MHSPNCWTSEDEARKAQASREELVAHLAQAIHDDGITEPLDGVRLRRASAPTEIGRCQRLLSGMAVATGPMPYG